MSTAATMPTYTDSAPLVRLQMVRERDLPAPPDCSSPEAAAAVLTPLLRDADREVFAVLLLDRRNRALGVSIAQIGTLDSIPVSPREVFKPALLANAAAVILAHNHPSGDPHPSREDELFTYRLKAAGALLGVGVLDHLVIGASTFCSLQATGRMDP